MLADLESPFAGAASSWPIVSRFSVVRCQSPWPRQRASRRLLNYRTAGPISVGTIVTRYPRCRSGLAANRSRVTSERVEPSLVRQKNRIQERLHRNAPLSMTGAAGPIMSRKAVWRLLFPRRNGRIQKGCILSTTGADKEPNSGKLHLQGETHGFEET